MKGSDTGAAVGMVVGSYIRGLESVEAVCERLGEKQFLQLYGDEYFEDDGQDEECEELALVAMAGLENLYDQAACSSRAESVLGGTAACRGAR